MGKILICWVKNQHQKESAWHEASRQIHATHVTINEEKSSYEKKTEQLKKLYRIAKNNFREENNALVATVEVCT